MVEKHENDREGRDTLGVFLGVFERLVGVFSSCLYELFKQRRVSSVEYLAMVVIV